MSADPSKPDESARFREQATAAFWIFIVMVLAVAVGLVYLGWWLFSWWGLVAGAVLAIMFLAGGLAAGAMIYAMSQDSG